MAVVTGTLTADTTSLQQSVSDGLCCRGRIYEASNLLCSCNGMEYKDLQLVLLCFTPLALRDAHLLLTLIA